MKFLSNVIYPVAEHLRLITKAPLKDINKGNQRKWATEYMKINF